MATLKLKTQNTKGGNPTWKERLGYTASFIDGEQNYIVVDAYEGQGKTYKERDKCNIEIVCSIPKKLGASELRWNGTFDELVEILLKQQTKTA